MLRNARARAERHGLPFNLKLQDILIPTFCPVLGIPVFVRTGKGSGDNSPSLDRIIPAKGYVRGNVVVVSNKANRIRNNATPAEMRLVAQYYERLLMKRK